MDAHEIAYYAVRGTDRDPVKDVEKVEKMIEQYAEQRAGTASAVDTIVSNTVGIQLNDDFNGGKIVMDTDIWDMLKKFKGKTISVKSKELDVHIAIKE